MATGTGISPDFINSAPRGVMGSTPRIDLDFQLRRSGKSCRQPTSVGSHRSSLPYSATPWTHASWKALMLSGTTAYVLVTVRSLASASLAFFRHWLWCSLNSKCASIQTCSQHVACALNRMDPFPTLIFAIRFGQSCSCGIICRRIVPPPSLQCRTVALVCLPTRCTLLRIS
jgi:hypothetical protein